MKVSAEGCKHVFYHFRRSFHGVRTLKTKYKDDTQCQIFIRLLKLMFTWFVAKFIYAATLFPKWQLIFSAHSHFFRFLSYLTKITPSLIRYIFLGKIPIPNKIQVCNPFIIIILSFDCISVFCFLFYDCVIICFNPCFVQV